MPSVKYNPLKHVKNVNSSSSKTISRTTNTNTSKSSNFKIIITIFLLLALILLGCYLMNYNKSDNCHCIEESKSLKFTDGYDINKIPTGNVIENFNVIDNFESTSTVPIDSSSGNNTPPKSFEELTLDEQQEKCLAISRDIIAFRNKLSGATFRFQKVDKFSTVEDYFLLGELNNGRVIEALQDTSLKYAIKDSSKASQLFTKVNVSTGSNDVYFISKEYPDYALQYEHDHISLRTHNNTPYEGQKFIELDENDKAIKDSISFGIGKPHLSKDDLESQGPRTFVFIGNDGNATTETDINQLVNQSQTNLDNLTHEQLKEVISAVLRDYNQYKLSEQKTTSGLLGYKPLQFNVNLGSSSNTNTLPDVEGFGNISDNSTDIEHFDNLRNSVHNSYDVRTLLNMYSQQLNSISPQQSASFGNNNLAGVSPQSDNASTQAINNITSSVDEYVNKLQQAAAGTSFKGCPRIDKSKYITGRQLSRCYGCNPDSSLQ